MHIKDNILFYSIRSNFLILLYFCSKTIYSYEGDFYDDDDDDYGVCNIVHGRKGILYGFFLFVFKKKIPRYL